jgi:hypothetical protein
MKPRKTVAMIAPAVEIRLEVRRIPEITDALADSPLSLASRTAESRNTLYMINEEDDFAKQVAQAIMVESMKQ